MLLCKTYPTLFILFLSLLMLDLFSHWFQMYSTLVAGNVTHKVQPAMCNVSCSHSPTVHILCLCPMLYVSLHTCPQNVPHCGYPVHCMCHILRLFLHALCPMCMRAVCVPKCMSLSAYIIHISYIYHMLHVPATVTCSACFIVCVPQCTCHVLCTTVHILSLCSTAHIR